MIERSSSSPANSFARAAEAARRRRRRGRDDARRRRFGGHGRVGVLAAIFMARHFERVIVRDIRRPAAFDDVLAAAVEVAPWVEGRVVYEEEAVGLHAPLPTGRAVAACTGDGAHRRDHRRRRRRRRALDRVHAVLLPLDGGERAEALRLSLGVPLAADVMRTLELERLGYTAAVEGDPARRSRR